MESTSKRPQDSSAPIDVNLSSREFTQDLAQSLMIIVNELRKHSNKDARELLSLASADRQMRVIPMDRPISQPPVRQVPPELLSGRRAVARRQLVNPPPAPAAWKSAKEWVDATHLHENLVSQIKSESNAEAKATLVTQLHNHEADMKSLRARLRGFPRPGQ